MNITGIIAEYNPFHNGHRYQIERAREQADAVVIVMSGSFVQRGDVALFDKWTRAKAALINGADLVLELPVCYACATAERFAYGAAATLDALGIVDSLCFGSECGDIAALKRAANLLLEEPPAVSKKIKQGMHTGLPYPAARQAAFSEIIPAKLLEEPNNILALEYICALRRLNSAIKPITIRRIGTDYHADSPSGNFASATMLRQMLQANTPIDAYVPYSAIHLYRTAAMHSISRLDAVITYLLRTCTPEYLRTLPDVTEGLEHRLIEAARKYGAFETIAAAAKTKRYPLSRIRRVLINALLGIDKSLCQMPPEYIRVLGMNQTGMQLLSKAKNSCPLPIIVKAADYKKSGILFQKDVLATDIAALCVDIPPHNSGMDFTISPIILNNL